MRFVASAFTKTELKVKYSKVKKESKVSLGEKMQSEGMPKQSLVFKHE